MRWDEMITLLLATQCLLSYVSYASWCNPAVQSVLDGGWLGMIRCSFKYSCTVYLLLKVTTALCGLHVSYGALLTAWVVLLSTLTMANAGISAFGIYTACYLYSTDFEVTSS